MPSAKVQKRLGSGVERVENGTLDHHHNHDAFDHAKVQKSESVTDQLTDQLTGIGSKDTCVSEKEEEKREKRKKKLI